MEPVILAFDTSSEACSVAVIYQDKINEKITITDRGQAKSLLTMIDEILNEEKLNISDINAIAFGKGPGAFTGVRIATGIAQGLAYPICTPVIPISSLAALAQRAYSEYKKTNVIVATDARMGEIYYGHFREHNGLMINNGQEHLCKPEELTLLSDTRPSNHHQLKNNNQLSTHNELSIQGQLTGIGTGWIYRDQIPVPIEECYTNEFPHASSIALLATRALRTGDICTADQAHPVYLRNNIAQVPKKKSPSCRP